MDSKYKTCVILQCLITLICTLIPLGFNSTLAWSSPAQIYLIKQKVDDPYIKEDFHLSTFVSIMGNISGFMIYPPFVKVFGTKWTMLIFSIPQVISWLLVAVYEEFNIFCASRFISGVGCSGALSALTEYLTIISSTKNRGIIFCIMNLASTLGTYLPLYLPLWISYFQLNIVQMVIPATFFFAFLITPSPLYFQKMNKWKEEKIKEEITTVELENEIDINDNNLTTKNRPIETKSIRTRKCYEKSSENPGNRISSENSANNNSSDNSNVRSNPETITIEIESSDCLDDKSNETDTTHDSKNGCLVKSTNIELLTEPNNRKGLFIMLCISALDIFGGHLAVAAYTEEIIVSPMRDLLMQTDLTVYILTGLKVFGVLFSSLLVERVERKNLLFWTGCASSLSTAFAGTFYFLSRYIPVERIKWFLLSSMTVSEVSSAIGIGNTFFVLQGELFAKNVRTLAISATNLIYLCIQFLVMTLLMHIKVHDLDYIFWFSSFVGFILSLIIYFIVPNIQGNTLEEIKEKLKS